MMMSLEEIGAAIREARKSRKMTQTDLAQAVGLSRYTIIQLESGQVSDIGIRKVLSILNTLALEMSIQKMQTKRPTLNEMYALRDKEDEERAQQYRRYRPRV